MSFATTLKAAAGETKQLNPTNPTRAIPYAMGMRKINRKKKTAMPIKPTNRELIL